MNNFWKNFIRKALSRNQCFFLFYRKNYTFDILNKPFENLTKPFYRKINAFFHFYRKSNAFVVLTKPFEISKKTFFWPSLFITKSMRLTISIEKWIHLLYWTNPFNFLIKPSKFWSSPFIAIYSKKSQIQKNINSFFTKN